MDTTYEDFETAVETEQAFIDSVQAKVEGCTSEADIIRWWVDEVVQRQTAPFVHVAATPTQHDAGILRVAPDASGRYVIPTPPIQHGADQRRRFRIPLPRTGITFDVSPMAEPDAKRAKSAPAWAGGGSASGATEGSQMNPRGSQQDAAQIRIPSGSQMNQRGSQQDATQIRIPSIADEISALRDLRDQGALSEDEFQTLAT